MTFFEQKPNMKDVLKDFQPDKLSGGFSSMDLMNCLATATVWMSHIDPRFVCRVFGHWNQESCPSFVRGESLMARASLKHQVPEMCSTTVATKMHILHFAKKHVLFVSCFSRQKKHPVYTRCLTKTPVSHCEDDPPQLNHFVENGQGGGWRWLRPNHHVGHIQRWPTQGQMLEFFCE